MLVLRLVCLGELKFFQCGRTGGAKNRMNKRLYVRESGVGEGNAPGETFYGL